MTWKTQFFYYWHPSFIALKNSLLLILISQQKLVGNGEANAKQLAEANDLIHKLKDHLLELQFNANEVEDSYKDVVQKLTENQLDDMRKRGRKRLKSFQACQK